MLTGYVTLHPRIFHPFTFILGFSSSGFFILGFFILSIFIPVLSSSHFHPRTFILALSSSHFHPHTFILTLSSSHFHLCTFILALSSHNCKDPDVRTQVPGCKYGDKCPFVDEVNGRYIGA